ncbi:hypothetical protein [Solimonas terrae]|uniref:Uncharacterized protein n=1 Tax=Solimonas terrae TaxID=1396819 RepID=A0A6M2BU85_9GAMM|nr:hypothetical protein [Solimonas terrae]NGY05934.1 hypothetical protein [Solimonas terrae]
MTIILSIYNSGTDPVPNKFRQHHSPSSGRDRFVESLAIPATAVRTEKAHANDDAKHVSGVPTVVAKV